MKKVGLIVAVILLAPSIHSAYYDLLPKGVRAFGFRRVIANNISEKFNDRGLLQSYGPKIDLSGDSLKGLSSAVDVYLNALQTGETSDNSDMTLGEYEMKADVDVKVDAFGLGYGVTRWISVYAFVPYYAAKVDLTLTQTRGPQYRHVITDEATQSGVILKQMPDIDSKLVNAVVQDYYGYEPIGDWNARGFGDLEVGLMFNPIKRDTWGIGVQVGTVAPTGRVDDSNNIQDFGFGDGQWDLFLESGFGYAQSDRLQFDLWTRYTHQLPYDANIRQPEDPDYPISLLRANSRIKLGDLFQVWAQQTFKLNSFLNFSFGYQYDSKKEDDYTSAYPKSDLFWEIRTQSYSQSYKLTLESQSLDLFKSEKFPIPALLTATYQENFSARNTPHLKRINLEMKVFF